MDLVDTHCHIQSAGRASGEQATRELWAKADGITGTELARRAQQAGVTRLLCVGCDVDDSRLAVDFVQDQPACWASVGIHPHEAQHYAQGAEKHAELAAFAKLAKQPKVVAIGECGLDYFYEHSPRNAQLELLRLQIELALQHDLPLIFHVREAFDDFWPVFDSYSGLRGVLHSFTDSADNLEKALTRNLFIGVNGIATFTKGPHQAIYRQIPLEKLLLETDAPFLTPVPYRGTINEPKYVGLIADFLSELRGEQRQQLATVTTHNARTLFGL